MTVLLGAAGAKEPWVWGFTGVAALSLLVLNVLLLVGVHARRMRQAVRTRREKRFRARLDEVLDEIDPRSPSGRDPHWLARELAQFDELERPIAAVTLIERVRPGTTEERADTLQALRDAGAIDVMLKGLRRRMPWRRALAVRTLGWVGADEAVPTLLFRGLADRNRYVRESTVRALGRIGDVRALAPLGALFRAPGRAGPGIVYDALMSFGVAAEPIFAGALRSDVESVRVASCFGIAAVADPDTARPLIVPLLTDGSARVRAAASESLGQLGGELLPDGLARASRDEQATVRSVATGALGSFDDPRAVELALNALLDPDRDTAIRAGEALVRLSRLRAAGPAADAALARTGDAWPVVRARTFASLGVV
jgi:HEAT repeat protein